MFELQHVSVVHGGQQVLQAVNLRLEVGERVALVGASGAGKSTVLRLLVGLEWPSEGRVRLDGQAVDRHSVGGLRPRVGYVIQEGGLLPHLTAAENIALPARVAGWEAARTRARLRSLRELVQLPADALERYPRELSGGQRQRVALMRALCIEPRALLLDEPLGALDPVIRYGLQEELRQIFDATGVTVLLVSHDLAEASFLASRLVVLDRGRLVQEGRLADLQRAPATPEVKALFEAVRPLPEPPGGR